MREISSLAGAVSSHHRLCLKGWKGHKLQTPLDPASIYSREAEALVLASGSGLYLSIGARILGHTDHLISSQNGPPALELLLTEANRPERNKSMNL